MLLRAAAVEPTLVLFDVDGTLVETGGAGRLAFVEAGGRLFGRDGFARAAGRVRFQGRTDPTIVEEIVEVAGIGLAEFRRHEARFWSLYLDLLRETLARPGLPRRVLPGVVELLDELERRAGVHLGLLTGNIEAGARAKLGSLGLNRYFPGGGFASDHRDRRVIARLARDKLSAMHGIEFAAARTVVVGDTGRDVDCARANGYRAVAVDHGWVPRHELESARPDALLDGFTDLDAALRSLLPLEAGAGAPDARRPRVAD